MKQILIISACCTLLQLSVSLAVAEELPAILDPRGYRETLPGMPPPKQISSVGTLKGNIHTTDGTPLSRGMAYFFNGANGPPPAAEKYWRVPDITAPLDDAGGFSVELSPGRYYIGAIKRKDTTAKAGLPEDGDIFYDGKTLYEVLPGSVNDITIIKGGRLFSADMLQQAERVTAIEGSVLDAAGNPVEHAMVFAYANAEMSGRPLFVSVQTDKKGSYRLRVAGNGPFFLRVSDVNGQSLPVDGKVAGGSSVTNPGAVEVKEGEVIKNITFTVVDRITPR